MTCIVGLVHDGTVYIGGDSAGISGLDLSVRDDPKVFTNGPYAFGFTSSFRMGQLLHYAFEPPAPPSDPGDLDRFMVTTFINAVRACLRNGGFAQDDRGQERGGTFLVGVGGRLYLIGADYQVGMPTDRFHAIGCGDQIAHGSLWTSDGLEPEDRVLLALNAAQRFSAGVRAPFKIVHVP